MASVRRRHVPPDAPARGGGASEGGGLARKVRALDVYPKTLAEFNEKTDVGGLVSVCAIGLIALLVVSQLSAYCAVRTHEHLSVDVERERLIRINLNITFPSIPCAGIGLVTMDVAGEQQIDVVQNVAKTRLALDGSRLGAEDGAEGDVGARALAELDGPVDAPERCGRCYTDVALNALFLQTIDRAVADAREKGRPLPQGASSRCCNSCDDVRATYQRMRLIPTNSPQPVFADWQTHPLCAHDRELIDPGALGGIHEGCNLVGFLLVNKVAGNFHVAPGRAFSSAQGHLVHEFKPFAMASYNTSHVIHALSFGPPYPSQLNPLDGVAKVNANGSALYQYYIKVVPTSYAPLGREPIATCQYSVTEARMPIAPDAGRGGRREFVLPGVFFIYDISPIKVAYTEQATSLWTFITSLCAIIGGVFVVARMVDSALHSVSRRAALAI
ncbi:hypothetical protein KFE25_002316 [Diacronema lutheri]|uniref:Uncharacterized protein n=1 Tax=Diacronema lutheri TaxID=2081491 RepID=A0A8J5XBI8_DIALT|nr:hypothetical protein KFE25_002316 [Diacronema lutheri]